MNRKLTITFSLFVLLLIACTKNASNPNLVLIRIENATTDSFSNFTLNTTAFGSITSGDTSKYFRCENVLPFPFANFIAINNNNLYIVDIAPTPYLESGSYLMKVINDSLPWRYQAGFIKE